MTDKPEPDPCDLDATRLVAAMIREFPGAMSADNCRKNAALLNALAAEIEFLRKLREEQL